jgi:DNA-binding CsgD family transcriptional regulator
LPEVEQRLPARQYEVLKLLVANKSSKEIAEELKISVKTVETYRARILERFGLHSVGQLIVFAIRNNLVQL